MLYFIWKRLIIPIAIIGIAYLSIKYFILFFNENGIEKSVTTLILLLAAIIGILHLILFAIVRILGPEKTHPKTNNRARKFNQFRKSINYITPFALIAILYHFWQNDWFLGAIIVSILLLDRMNDLLRKDN
jgi:hypothetical protein